MPGTAREEVSAVGQGGSREEKGTRNKSLGQQWVGAGGFCRGGRREVGTGKFFVSCNPLCKGYGGNSEPSKNRRKKLWKN